MHLLDPIPTLSNESLEEIKAAKLLAPQYVLQIFTDKDANKLLDALKECPKTVLLYLFFSPRSTYLSTLAFFLEQLRSLEKPVGLNLYSVKLDANCLQNINQLVATDKLSHLDIGACKAPYCEIKPILISAQRAKRLHELHCDENNLSDSEEISLLIERNDSLKSLSLSKNGIGSKGGMLLAEALSKNTTIEVLNLSFNNLGTEAFKKICCALINRENIIHIKKLQFSMLGLDDESTPFICELLEKTRIEKLNISGNKFTQSSLKAFANSVEKSSTLIDFQINGNRFFPGHNNMIDPDLNKYPDQQTDYVRINDALSKNKGHQKLPNLF